MNLNDSGKGSLRAAIVDAGNGDTVDFARGLHGSITLASELPVSGSVTINGPGANHLAISGDGGNRIFDISGSSSVTISGLTITNGLAVQGGILLEEARPQHQQLHTVPTTSLAVIRPELASVVASRTTRQEH